jgi:lipopolysaccharide/colanic/teichoic acid biosynthesis glycosyltransferase
LEQAPSREENEEELHMQHDIEHSTPVMSQSGLYTFDQVIQTTPGYFSQMVEAACVRVVDVEEEEEYAYISPKQSDGLLLEESVISPFYLFLRRTVDVIFALCGAMVMLLILPILAPLIYLDSPGPIFYSQERLGYLGKKFQILKFRSMRVDAEAEGRAIWAAEHDQRVTRVGRFMRAVHLDELPQVINILRGEMSLIGPRPEREEFVSSLEKTIPCYRDRLNVRPGLTGWAQVKYRYTRTDQEALVKLQYDLYYIKCRSIKLDLLIILKTVAEVLSYHGS